jgi:multicomponent Na+:H+ antiporter subunit D
VLGGAFVVAALALAGLPPFGTGLGKALAEESAGSPVLVAVFVLVSAVTDGAVLRAGLRVYFGLGRHPETSGSVTAGTPEKSEVRERLPRAPLTMVTAIAGLLALGLAMGAVPALTSLAGRAAADLTATGAYRSAVLAGHSAVPAAAHAAWSGAGLLLSALSTALAVGFAAVALRGTRAPAAVRGPVAVLHRLHSGHVGDYVAWLLLGAGLLAGTVVLVG